MGRTRWSATLATASFFPVLGVRPILGRAFTETEDVEGASEGPCVVSYRFWRSELAGTASVPNQTVNVWLDVLLLGSGTTVTEVSVSSFLAPPARGFELRLARVVAGRMAAG